MIGVRERPFGDAPCFYGTEALPSRSPAESDGASRRRTMCGMKPDRKAARSRIKAMPTKAELALALERSTLTPDQREAVFLVFGCGETRVKVASDMGVSLSFVNKAIASAYDKLG